MTASVQQVRAFLEYEAEWHLRYAEVCREVSASLPANIRGRDWNSRANAAYRRAQACLEELGALQGPGGLAEPH